MSNKYNKGDIIWVLRRHYEGDYVVLAIVLKIIDEYCYPETGHCDPMGYSLCLFEPDRSLKIIQYWNSLYVETYSKPFLGEMQKPSLKSLHPT